MSSLNRHHNRSALLIMVALSACRSSPGAGRDTVGSTDSYGWDGTGLDTGDSGEPGDPPEPEVSVIPDLGEWAESEAPDGVEVSGWTWQNPLPQGLDLSGVWAESEDEVWLAGAYGTLLRMDGSTFERIELDTSEDLNAIHGGWIVGGAGTAFRWDGLQWTPTPTPTTATLWDVWASAPDRATAVSEDGEVLRWDGSDWSIITEVDAPLRGTWEDWVVGDGVALQWDGSEWISHELEGENRYFDVGGVGQDVWLIGDYWPESSFVTNLGIWHFDGTDWEDLSTDHYWRADRGGVWVSEDGIVQLVSEDGLVHIDGSEWHTQSTSRSLSGVFGLSSDQAWYVGPAGFIGEWDGDSLRERSHGSRESLYAVGGSSSEELIAAGDYTTMHHWDGSAWNPVPTGIETSHWEGYQKGFAGIWAAAPDDVWAAGYGTIAHWDGAAWEERLEGGNYWGNWGSGPDDVWAVGPESAIHWNGSDWQDHSADFPPDFTARDVSGVDSDTAWTVGDYGMIFAWDGTSWTAQASPQDSQLLRVDAWSEDLAFAVGKGNTVVKWDGSTWNVEPLPEDTTPYWYGVSVTAADEAWVVGGPDVLKWDGSEWAEVETPDGLQLRRVHADPDSGLRIAGADGQILFRP